MFASLLWVVPVALFAYLTVVNRWPVAEGELARLGVRASVVGGVSLERGLTDTSHVARRTQVYVTWPTSFRTWHAYAVTEDEHGVHTEPTRLGLLVYGLFYGVWIGTSIWYLARRWLLSRA